MAMVVGLERLEYFVEALEEESPKIMQRPKVADTFSDMCRVVMVGLYDTWSIELSSGVSMSENRTWNQKDKIPISTPYHSRGGGLLPVLCRDP